MYVKPMMLNEKLGAHIGGVYPPAQDIQELFGVEVELEGSGGIANPTLQVKQLWTVHEDGSLRKLEPGDEAIEYVTRHPYNKDEIGHVVKVLMEFLNDPEKKVYDSYRTSIHVHVNCLADTFLHIYNFITLCLLFDELFVSQNGEHRIGNNFCLRSKDAQGQVVELIYGIEHSGNIFGYGPNNRYSSINFASLLKFGTVEFRSLECTTDPIRIMHWIRTINALKKASRTFEDPQDIIRKFSQMSSEDFVVRALGPQAIKYLNVPNYSDMLFQGMRLAQEFAFCSKWIPREAGAFDDKMWAVKKKMAGGPPQWAHIGAEVQPAYPADDDLVDEPDDLDDDFYDEIVEDDPDDDF